MTINSKKFLQSVEDSINWRRRNLEDPYGIDNAVIAALEEIRNAIETALEEQDQPVK